jgi:hypothetical protein
MSDRVSYQMKRVTVADEDRRSFQGRSKDFINLSSSSKTSLVEAPPGHRQGVPRRADGHIIDNAPKKTQPSGHKAPSEFRELQLGVSSQDLRDRAISSHHHCCGRFWLC